MAQGDGAGHICAVAVVLCAKVHGDKIPRLQLPLPSDAVGHTGIGAGDDNRVKGQAVGAVFIQGGDELGIEPLFRHPRGDLAANLGEGGVGNALGLDHAGQLPGFLRMAAAVEHLLGKKQRDIQPLCKLFMLCDGHILLFDAKLGNPLFRHEGLQIIQRAMGVVRLADVAVRQRTVGGFNIAGVGKKLTPSWQTTAMDSSISAPMP